MTRSFLAWLCCIATVSSAVASTLVVRPHDATTQDPLVLEVLGAPPCATVAFDGVELLEDGYIRVAFDDGSRVLCSRPPDPCPLRIPLGRLPAGQYTIAFVPDRPSLTNAAEMSLIVYPALYPDGAETANFSQRRLSDRKYRGPHGCT